MDFQDTFDKVVKHLLQQNAQSRQTDGLGTGRCAYRGIEGRRCAIGALIPDDQYTQAMEGCGVNVTSLGNPTLQKILLAVGIKASDLKEYLEKPSHDHLIPETVKFLGSLQEVHDVHLPPRWPQQLSILAHNWKLKTHALVVG